MKTPKIEKRLCIFVDGIPDKAYETEEEALEDVLFNSIYKIIEASGGPWPNRTTQDLLYHFNIRFKD